MPGGARAVPARAGDGARGWGPLDTRPVNRPSSTDPTLRLRRPLRSAIEAGHPWIWRDALEPFQLAPGTTVRVADEKGPAAVGFVEAGPIGVRILSTRPARIDEVFFAGRVARAATLRERVVPPSTDAYRLVNGEGDGLPGVHVDVYGPWAVLKLDGEGITRWRDALVEAVRAACPSLEGLLVRTGRGEAKQSVLAFGTAPPPRVDVREHGMWLRADLVNGQKTGLFLDHRESRLRVRTLARGLRVLNLYGYTGGFSVAAGLGLATEVDTVDVAAPALALAQESWALNGLPEGAHRTHARDVPEVLDELRARGRRFDLIVADPPSFAPNEASVPQAMKSYRALHRACLRLLEPNALYLAASCSSHIDRVTFDRTLREAAEKTGPVQVLERWGAPADHPRPVAFPEGDYLKVILARRLD